MFNFDDNTKVMYDNKIDGFGFEPEKVCPKCNNTLTDFLRSGVLGCVNCYKVFETEIRSMLLRNQGSINHIGKISLKHISKNSLKQQIKELEERKERAAKEENYIEAEDLKNKIEKLKGEL